MQHNPLLETALRYWRQGLLVLPGIPGKKHPKVEYKIYHRGGQWPTEADYHRWFSTNDSLDLLLVTGEKSGISVVDADNAKAVEWCDANFPLTVYQTTPRKEMSKHYFFKHVDGVTSKTNIFKDERKIDVRGHDNGIAVLSPSRGYTMIGELNGHLPPFPKHLFPQFQQRPKSQPAQNQISVTSDQIYRMLEQIDPDCTRDEWVKVGMALHNIFQANETGFRLFDEWSQKSPKYGRDKGSNETRIIYNSFDLSKPDQISLGTLLNLAQRSSTPQEDFAKFKSYDSVVSQLTEKFEMKQKFVNSLGDEKWAYPNLIIENQITIVIAPPGGGKTAFFMREVCPKLVEAGYTVLYADIDSPASDYKRIKALSNEHGFKLLNPNTRVGESEESLIKELTAIADQGRELGKHVFIFDTLKKFCDVISKRNTKEFLRLLRKLNTFGATPIALGHANKYADAEGQWVYEGTGDVKSDTDNLIFFYPEHMKYLTTVTTVVDPNINKYVKVSGLFEPFSFNIKRPSREIELLDSVQPLPEPPLAKIKTTEKDILLALAQALHQHSDEEINQDLLVRMAMAISKAGKNRVFEILTTNEIDSEKPDIVVGLGLFQFRKGGPKNREKIYSLTQTGQDYIFHLGQKWSSLLD